MDIALGLLLILGAISLSSLSEVPHLRLWVLYGALLSAAYIKLAFELGYLTDPVRIVYQLYRYCWRGILFYPLVWMFFQEEHRLRRLVFTMVLCADILGLVWIRMSRLGIAYELGIHKNGIGGFLILPIFLALGLALYGSTAREKTFYRSSLFVQLAALWYAQSRGAVAGVFCGMICFGLVDGFFYTKKGLVTMILASLLMVTTILLIKPDFGEGSGIRDNYIGLVENPTEEDNFQWRVQNRWGYFLEKVLSNPILGVGEAADLTLGRRANTPHNAYLEIAVKSGIPALVVFLSFITIAMRRAFYVVKSRKGDSYGGLAIGILCGIVAVCIASIVDGHFTNPTVQPWLWVTIGLSVLLAIKFTPGIFIDTKGTF